MTANNAFERTVNHRRGCKREWLAAQRERLGDKECSTHAPE
jgi:hypothetical protein